MAQSWIQDTFFSFLKLDFPFLPRTRFYVVLGTMLRRGFCLYGWVGIVRIITYFCDSRTDSLPGSSESVRAPHCETLIVTDVCKEVEAGFVESSRRVGREVVETKP